MHGIKIAGINTWGRGVLQIWSMVQEGLLTKTHLRCSMRLLLSMKQAFSWDCKDIINFASAAGNSPVKSFVDIFHSTWFAIDVLSNIKLISHCVITAKMPVEQAIVDNGLENKILRISEDDFTAKPTRFK